MPKIDTDNCMSCGMCVDVCPADAIKIISTHGYSRFEINQDKCIECLSCLEVGCPGEAITE